MVVRLDRYLGEIAHDLQEGASASAVHFLLTDRVDEDESEHGREHAHSSDGTIDGYGEFEFNRPPFKLNSKPNAPLYEEADETFDYEIENRVFSLDTLTAPPDDSSEQVKRLYRVVKKAHKVMMRDVDDVINLNEYHLNQDPMGVTRAARYRISKAMGFNIKSPRKRRDDHFKSKMYYLLARRAYTHAMRTDPALEDEASLEFERDFQETALIALCHIFTNMVKTACHTKRSARRKSGRLVMMHAYRVAITAFNEHEEDIRAAKTREEIQNVYRSLQIDAVAKVFHDFKEDFQNYFNDKYMRKKESQYILNSMPLQAMMADVPHLSRNTNLQGKVDPLNEINEDIDTLGFMLMKPSTEVRLKMNCDRLINGKTAQLEPHIEEKMLNHPNEALGLRAFKIKLDDRRDNIETLVPEKAEQSKGRSIRQRVNDRVMRLVGEKKDIKIDVRQQLKKLIEARELIQTAHNKVLWNEKYTKYPNELRAIQTKVETLRTACLRELDRIGGELSPTHPCYQTYLNIRECTESTDQNHDTYTIGAPLIEKPLIPSEELSGQALAA